MVQYRRISDDELEKVKSQLELATLVRSKGVELKKHGSKDLIGHCPFHEDDTASLVVTPSKNLFHCMGCGAGGSVIDFVMKHDGISFRHAVELIKEQNPALFGNNRKPSKHGEEDAGALKKSSIPKLVSPVDYQARGSALLGDVVSYYQQRLEATAEAKDYLKTRGISEEAIAKFRIGFADRTLGLRIPNSQRVDGKRVREGLVECGVYRNSGHEHFTGCVTFPVFDKSGAVTEMYGRKIGKQKSGIYHLYLPGKHVGVYNPEAFESTDIILCESILDALTFWSHGLKNVTTIYGCEGFTEEIEQAFITHKTSKVYFAYDNDKAGNRAVERDKERLQALGIECFRLPLPNGKDANEYALEGGDLRGLFQTVHPIRSDRAGTSFSLAAKEKSLEVVENPSNEMIAPVTQTLTLEEKGDCLETSIGDRTYRILGLEKNNSSEVLRVQLRLLYEENFHLDTVDFYQDKQRIRFIQRASEETTLRPELLKKDIAKLLLCLEQERDSRIRDILSPSVSEYEMTPAEHEEALTFLKSPKLIERLKEEFNSSGVVGEDSNKLTAWLACVSRKLDRPLAVIIQSTSAAGKTTLMESVLKMMPAEERIKYSAMTGQSLFYLGESNLKHKILAIVEEEGAEKASYALKLLQSEGELTIASTGKDATTGRMETQEYHVEGPVMIFLTTTAIDIDEELMNRCLVLTVDEGKEQTQRIFEQQRNRRMEKNIISLKKRENVLRRQCNVQRLLKPVHVVNNYASELTFVSHRTRSRRDHEKYLTLIDTITLAHQYQRELVVKNIDGERMEFIRTSLEDIALANELAPEVLGRSLDELPPQTRRLLNEIIRLVKEHCEKKQMEIDAFSFSRRWLREQIGWSEYQVRIHIQKLEEMEYLARTYGKQGQTYSYMLLIDPDEDESNRSIGLIDVIRLQRNFEGSKGKFEHTSLKKEHEV